MQVPVHMYLTLFKTIKTGVWEHLNYAVARDESLTRCHLIPPIVAPKSENT